MFKLFSCYKNTFSNLPGMIARTVSPNCVLPSLQVPCLHNFTLVHSVLSWPLHKGNHQFATASRELIVLLKVYCHKITIKIYLMLQDRCNFMYSLRISRKNDFHKGYLNTSKRRQIRKTRKEKIILGSN